MVSIFVVFTFLFPLTSSESKDSVIDSACHVYLTFDDGPRDGSKSISEIARSTKTDITVFIIGKHVLKNKRPYLDYRNNPYILIGNHSFVHANDRYISFYSDPHIAFRDFIKNQVFLNNHNKICRLPARNIWRLSDTLRFDTHSGVAVADSLYHDGFKVYGWDLEWENNPKNGKPIQNADQLVNSIEIYFKLNKTVRPHHLILLAHDVMMDYRKGRSVLKKLIFDLKAKGYVLNNLNNYPY